MSIFIYVLVSSRDENVVWYVGQSVDVHGRYENHHARDSRTAKGQWIQRERESGFAVRPRIIEECPTKAIADDREAYWIGFFRELNSELMNGTDGAYTKARQDFLGKVAQKQRSQLQEDLQWFESLLKSAR